MTKRQWGGLAIVALVILGISGAALVQRAHNTRQAREDFFALREAVRNKLAEARANPLKGTTVVLPLKTPLPGREESLFPGQRHIESVLDGPELFSLHPLSGHDWQSRSSFSILLELDDSILSAGPTVKSDTMPATVILNYYFSGLEDLGFRTGGTPGAVMGKVQSASNVWFMEGNESFVVSGTVFVAPDSKEAIILGEIEESLPSK